MVSFSACRSKTSPRNAKNAVKKANAKPSMTSEHSPSCGDIS